MKKYLSLLILLFLETLLFGQSSGFANSKGVKIFYQTVGEGKPVLVINGGPGFNSEGFLGIAEEIASLGYQAILYDQRGTGKSTMSNVNESNITMDLMAQDMEAIREDLDIESWILFGHSFGGIMANFYASEYPDRVSAMIHSSSGGIDLFLLEDAQATLLSRLTEVEIDSLNYWRQKYRVSNSDIDRENYTYYMASAYVYHKENVPPIRKRLMEGDLSLNGMVWSDLRRINYDCKEALSTFSKPVLIIQGEQDVIPKELALRADKVFSNSKMILLDECGHYGWLDQKTKYLGEISMFLREIEKDDVHKVVEAYVRSIYDHDSTAVSEITDSTLQKSGFYWSKKNQAWSYSDMSYSQLEHTASSYNSKEWIPDWAPVEIEIYDVNQRIASAKVKAIWGFDYLLLSKNSNGKWNINKILWQSYTEKEAESYFSHLKALKNISSTNK